MITGLPADKPDTTPEPDTVAIAVLLLLHVPPDVAFVNVVVDAGHTTKVPPIAAGCRFIVIGVVDTQP